MRWRLFGGMLGIVFFSGFFFVQAEDMPGSPPTDTSSPPAHFAGGLSLSNLGFQALASGKGLITGTLSNTDTYSAGPLFMSVEFAPKKASYSRSEATIVPFSDPVMLNPEEGKTISAQISIPSFLSGEKMVSVNVADENGRVIERKIAGSFTATATRALTLGECRFGDNGTVIAPSQRLSATDLKANSNVNCALKNNADTPSLYTATLVSYQDLFPGKLLFSLAPVHGTVGIGNATNTVFTISLGGNVFTPGHHELALSITDPNNMSLVANPFVFSIDIPGASASIDLLRVDKNNYAKGDTALVSFVVSAVGSKTNPTSSYETAITLMNDKNVACSETQVDKLTNGKGLTEVKVPITTDCTTPTLSLQVRDSDHFVLAQKTLTVKKTIAAGTPSSTPDTLGEKITRNWLSLVIVVIIFGIVTFFLWWGWKRKRGSSSPMALFLLFGLTTLLLGSFPSHVSAGFHAGYTWFQWFGPTCSGAGVDTYPEGGADGSVSFDKAAYAPGDTINATIQVQSYDINAANGLPGSAHFSINLDFDGVASYSGGGDLGAFQTTTDGFSFTAPAATGSHPVTGNMILRSNDGRGAGNACSHFNYDNESYSTGPDFFVVTSAPAPLPTVNLNGDIHY